MFPTYLAENLGQVIPGHLLDFEAVEYVLAGQFCPSQSTQVHLGMHPVSSTVYCQFPHELLTYVDT